MIWRPWKRIRALEARARCREVTYNKVHDYAEAHAVQLGEIETASDPLRDLLNMPVMVHTVTEVLAKAAEVIEEGSENVPVYLSPEELAKLEVNKNRTRK